MRKIAIPLILVFLLVGCNGIPFISTTSSEPTLKLDTPQKKVDYANTIIKSVSDSSTEFLRADIITLKEAEKRRAALTKARAALSSYKALAGNGEIGGAKWAELNLLLIEITKYLITKEGGVK